MSRAGSSDGRIAQIEGEFVVVESSVVMEFEARERPEQTADAVELLAGTIEPDLEPLVNVFVEMIEKGLPGFLHAGLDLFVEVLLKFREGVLDFVGRATLLIDLKHAAFEVDIAIDKTEHVVRSIEEGGE